MPESPTPVCDCAPDCAERIACTRTDIGHFGCGWCPTHDQARHICLCRATDGGASTFSCGRCGDDSEPAMCQDRHSFDDHGICCVGRCGVCQADMTDDYQGETA